jgi:choline dehydrogenase
MSDAGAAEWDYVIVGSGAGGATLAARLAEARCRVFLLEAGGVVRESNGPRLPADYQVPGFHAFAAENRTMSWNFEVRHYADEARQSRDPKYSAARGGVLYPRAAALGGCTTHNAMIYMLPHESDWQHIVDATGDRSWSPRQMRRFARRVEACHYRPLWRALRRLWIDPTGHGWDGWLRTEVPQELKALGDPEMRAFFVSASRAFARTRSCREILRWLGSVADPNARPWGRGSFEGLCYTPLSTTHHARSAGAERLLRVAAEHRGYLHIERHALATRVLLDPSQNAVGVEYLKGKHLYRADPAADGDPGEKRSVRARLEVILCAGAFNTPQLLMLSGIGPEPHLREHGIPVRVALAGVGRNLQDRYEVAVTHRMRRPWEALKGARFEQGDAIWERWATQRDGLYASNGAVIAFADRSEAGIPEPDIFGMALPTRFEGYFPGYSRYLQRYHDYLTWALLKAHTHNLAGTVSLRSDDPRDTPRVNFHYFEESTDRQGRDLRALVRAIGLVRKLMAPLIESGVIAEECAPGPAAVTEAALQEYIRDTAWGHHASCSCAIGHRNRDGVLTSEFAVHGTQKLRVVDASVFPRIPGFFPVSAVCIVAEKAAETILRGP